MISTAIQQLVNYGLDTGLILPDDEIYIRNQLLMTMQLDSFTEPEGDVCYADLESILKTLVDDAAARGVCDDSPTARDLFDTRLMGVLTPRPSIVRANFEERYETDGPQAATDWFYKFSQDTDYIRRYRIKRDVKWVTRTPYGDLDITINLSKPEKDPKAIAAAKLAPQSAYPKCQLCVENEGYAGRLNHPARENHRIIPLTINDSAWNFQYSPYVYYNEHCIVFNNQHTPMKIERATFRKLLDFVALFPHYFVGSNADLPIVGGSILSHDHFQGGHYEFAMAKAPIEKKWVFPGFEDVDAGIVHWPMSCIRLTCADDERLVELADQDFDRMAGLHRRELLCLRRDRRRAPQHHHPHRPDAGRQVPAGFGAAQQHHHAGASAGRLSPPRKAPPHQKGEHRPHRGHGSGRSAQPPESRDDRCGSRPREVLFSQRQKVVLTLAIRCYVIYFVQLRIAKVNCVLLRELIST